MKRVSSANCGAICSSRLQAGMMLTHSPLQSNLNATSQPKCHTFESEGSHEKYARNHLL